MYLVQVKVAIYNNGVEKANIIFNAVGADKNSWFTSDRIISSTWTDIKTAQKEIFSLAGYFAIHSIFFYIFCCFLEQETLHSLLSSGWIQEWTVFWLPKLIFFKSIQY
jgi:hypothetical protein